MDELGRWRDGRRAELDELDNAALQAATGSTATGDILLSMALWKAVSDRYELLLATWNSGRVGATELMRMSTLIWGRLDANTASGLSVSLPEACRLSDALLSQLRVKLGLDPSGDGDHRTYSTAPRPDGTYSGANRPGAGRCRTAAGRTRTVPPGTAAEGPC